MSSQNSTSKPTKRRVHRLSRDERYRAFTAYVKHASMVFGQRETLRERLTENPLKVAYVDPAYRLRSLAEEAEHSSLFKELCSLWGATGDVSIALRNFFRRSGFYIRAFNGRRESAERLFVLFQSTISDRRFKATRLRVLTEVAFASKEIDFATFKIQKFTKRELDNFTGREVSEIFYPTARMDTDFFSRFWFLVEDVSVDDVSKSNPAGSTVDYEDWSWTQIRPTVPDVAIQLLATHQWTPDLSHDECIERYQTDLDEVRNLRPGPIFGESFLFNHEWCVEPASLPRVTDIDSTHFFPVAKQQESKLKAIIEKGQKLFRITHAVRPNWDFVEIAMGYLGKAGLARPNLEQLLWNVAVLDCLLGDKAEVTQSIRRRIGNILGVTDQERRQVRKEFDELYDFRSDLVHGNKFRKKADFRHLAKARDFAGQAMCWFIDYLLWVHADFQQRDLPYEHYPRRDDLLYVLDLDKGSLNRLNRFVGRLPTGFPQF